MAKNGPEPQFEFFGISPEGILQAINALPAAIYTVDVEGRLTSYNKAAAELWGYAPQLGVEKWCGSWRLYRPDGTHLPHNESPAAVALREQRAIAGEEAVAERPDGSRVPFLAYPSPMRDASGTLLGAINVLMDITESKKIQDRKETLIRELKHRVKNILATVQAIASQSFRHSDSKEQSQEAFRTRLVALAKAYDLITQANWEGTNLAVVVRTIIEPYNDSYNRFQLQGPHVPLSASCAVTFSMALHELCTNAMKYGALSCDEGRITVMWNISGLGNGQHLHVTWTETGGPLVTQPTRKGFGSRLIEQALALELGGTAAIHYLPSGIVCGIEAPYPAPDAKIISA